MAPYIYARRYDVTFFHCEFTIVVIFAVVSDQTVSCSCPQRSIIRVVNAVSSAFLFQKSENASPQNLCNYSM